MPLERKTPVAYPDGVYEIAGKDRPNVLLIANVTQNGLTGFGSRERTALFIFFGELSGCIEVKKGGKNLVCAVQHEKGVALHTGSSVCQHKSRASTYS